MFIDSQCNDGYPRSYGEFYAKYYKTTHSCTLYCVSLFFDTANCILSIAFHMSVALKSQYLFVVGTKPFPANQNVKYGCFHFASNYSITFFGSASSMLALNIAFWRLPHVLMDSSSKLVRVWAWFVRQHTITWISFGQALWHNVAPLDQL